jgi:hypothetical protein
MLLLAASFFFLIPSADVRLYRVDARRENWMEFPEVARLIFQQSPLLLLTTARDKRGRGRPMVKNTRKFGPYCPHRIFFFHIFQPSFSVFVAVYIPTNGFWTIDLYTSPFLEGNIRDLFTRTIELKALLVGSLNLMQCIYLLHFKEQLPKNIIFFKRKNCRRNSIYASK